MTKMLNKVPEVTLFFWIIKILATTVGETVADFLSETLKFGLTGTSYIMGGVLLVVLIIQLWCKKYIAGIYWLVVVLLSIVGTLISDNLVDNMGVSLATSSIIFGSALAVVFVSWYLSEKTLSVHTIYTTKKGAVLLGRYTFYFLFRYFGRRFNIRKIRTWICLCSIAFCGNNSIGIYRLLLFKNERDTCFLDSLYIYPPAWRIVRRPAIAAG